MIEGIGVLIVICAFLFGFQRPGGVKDQVSQRIKNAPTDAQAQQVFASSALFWIGVVVVIAVMGISVMGGIVAEGGDGMGWILVSDGEWIKGLRCRLGGVVVERGRV